MGSIDLTIIDRRCGWLLRQRGCKSEILQNEGYLSGMLIEKLSLALRLYSLDRLENTPGRALYQPFGWSHCEGFDSQNAPARHHEQQLEVISRLFDCAGDYGNHRELFHYRIFLAYRTSSESYSTQPL